MMIDHDFLEEVVQKELGFESVDAFAKGQAHAIFKQKVTDCEAAIARFEAKYGMDLGSFQRRVVNPQDDSLRQFGIIEKEDDLMDWEIEDHSLPYLRQRLAQLAV